VGDRRRFEQILLNLLNNAIKFTDRGRVTLVADVVPHFRNSASAAPGAALRVRVSDTGIGIRPEHLTTLFQPFRQLDSGIDRQHEGTGLGLAICRRLAVLMGGEVAAASTWAEGSEFSVMLPLARQAVA
jgi:signal transduction histidine kinase